MFLPRLLIEIKSLVALSPDLERFLARRPQGRRFPALHCYPRARVLHRVLELRQEGINDRLPFARHDDGRELSVDLRSGAVHDTLLPREPLYPSFADFLDTMKTVVAEAGRRPLVRAARAGNLARIESLLRRGQDINEQDLDGNTPLMAALLAWQYPAAELLLQQDPDLARTDRNGHTALMWACYRDQPQLVARMLELGADPGVRTPHGDSVLLFAITAPKSSVGTGSPEAVRLLLAAGVDPAAPVDATGRNAFELAAAEGSRAF